MTKDADFKQLIRARMLATGETYAQARAALEHRQNQPNPAPGPKSDEPAADEIADATHAAAGDDPTSSDPGNGAPDEQQPHPDERPDRALWPVAGLVTVTQATELTARGMTPRIARSFPIDGPFDDATELLDIAQNTDPATLAAFMRHAPVDGPFDPSHPLRLSRVGYRRTLPGREDPWDADELVAWLTEQTTPAADSTSPEQATPRIAEPPVHDQ